MTENVTVIETPDERVVSIRRRVGLDELPAFLSEAFARFDDAAPATMTSAPPFVIYHEVTHDAFDAEVCRPVTDPVVVPSGLATHVEAGGPVASTIHAGSYDRLPATYMAMHRWMAAHGAIPAGPPRERYLVGPADTDRPSEYRTMVQIPCQVALVASR